MALNRRIFLYGTFASLASGAEKSVTDPPQLTSAIRAARPGDVIVLRDGTWRDLDLHFTGAGEPEHPITLRAQTPGKVILTGKSRLQMSGRYLVVDGLTFQDGSGPRETIAFRTGPKDPARFCRLTRCAIRNYSPPDKKQDSKWISLYGSDNRVDHCYFAGKTNLGQTMVIWLNPESSENRHRIDHNHFGPRPPLGVNGGESIRVGDSTTSMLISKATVEGNYFEACDGEIEVISNKSCENVYRGNRFERCQGTLTLRHGNRCLVEGNVFVGEKKSDTGGVRIIGEDHRVIRNYFVDLTGDGPRAAISLVDGIPNSPLFGYFEVKRARVEGNTIVNCAHPIVLGVPAKGASLAPEQCIFEGNVVVGDKGPLVRLLDAKTGVQWKQNVFFGAEVGFAGLEASGTKPSLPPMPPRAEAGPGYSM